HHTPPRFPYTTLFRSASEDACGLAGNGRDDHLQRLERDEQQGGEDPPLRERLLEELLVDVEADEVLVGGGVGPHEPHAVPDDGRDRKSTRLNSSHQII